MHGNRSRARLTVFLSSALLFSTLGTATSQDGSHGDSARLLGDFNCERIGFYKTHKTGSSSISVMLGKVGLMGNKKLSPCPGCSEGDRGQDLSIEHHAMPFSMLQKQWRETLDHPGLITMVREPVSRQVSHYFYYGYESWLEDVNEGLLRYRPRQVPSQAQELVQWSTSELVHRTRLWVRSQQFRKTFVVVTERLAESVAALHLHCGWPMRELYFGRVHCKTCWDVEVSKKGLLGAEQGQEGYGTVSHRASVRAKAMMADTSERTRNITRETREALERSLEADRVLYGAAVAKLEGVVKRGGDKLAAAARELTRRNAIVEEHCRREVVVPEDFAAHPGCLWIALLPKEFYALYNNTADGRVDLQRRYEIHFNSAEHNGLRKVMERGISAAQMLQAYNQMYTGLIGGG